MTGSPSHCAQPVSLAGTSPRKAHKAADAFLSRGVGRQSLGSISLNACQGDGEFYRQRSSASDVESGAAFKSFACRWIGQSTNAKPSCSLPMGSLHPDQFRPVLHLRASCAAVPLGLHQ